MSVTERWVVVLGVAIVGGGVSAFSDSPSYNYAIGLIVGSIIALVHSERSDA